MRARGKVVGQEVQHWLHFNLNELSSQRLGPSCAQMQIRENIPYYKPSGYPSHSLLQVEELTIQDTLKHTFPVILSVK